MHILSFQDYGGTGYEVHDAITTTIHLVTYNMVVDTTVHPGFCINSG